MLSRIRVWGLVILAGITLIGCIPNYSGPPDATVQDFMKARTECYTQLKSTSSPGAVGIIGGYLLRRPSASCGEFSGCLALKGFVVSDRGRFNPSQLGAPVTGCELTVG